MNFITYINLKEIYGLKNDLIEVLCHRCKISYYDKSTFLRHWKIVHLGWKKCRICNSIVPDIEAHSKECAINKKLGKKKRQCNYFLNKKRAREINKEVKDFKINSNERHNDISIGGLNNNKSIENIKNSKFKKKEIMPITPSKKDKGIQTNFLLEEKVKKEMEIEKSQRFSIKSIQIYNSKKLNDSKSNVIGVKHISEAKKKDSIKIGNPINKTKEKKDVKLVQINPELKKLEKNKNGVNINCSLNDNKIKGNASWKKNNNNSNYNDIIIKENGYIKNKNNKVPFTYGYLEKNELKDVVFNKSLNKNDFSEIYKEDKKKMIILRIMQKLDNIKNDGIILLIKFITKIRSEAVEEIEDNIKINMTIMKEKELIDIEKYIKNYLLRKYSL